MSVNHEGRAHVTLGLIRHPYALRPPACGMGLRENALIGLSEHIASLTPACGLYSSTRSSTHVVLDERILAVRLGGSEL
jgi:hypothetical protein